MSRFIELGQVYQIPDFEEVPVAPYNFDKLGDHEFNLDHDVQLEIDAEGIFKIRQAIKSNNGEVRTFWFNGSPFMITKHTYGERDRETFWITNTTVFMNAFSYLTLKNLGNSQAFHEQDVYTEESKILPSVFEGFDGANVKVFDCEALPKKKKGVLLIPAGSIIPKCGYHSHLVFVAEGVEPLSELICRQNVFLRRIHTYTVEELNKINERITQPLAWYHGPVRDYHLYDVVQNTTDENFDVI